MRVSEKGNNKEWKKKNRVRINLSTMEIEVESSTETLGKVLNIADRIIRNLPKGTLGIKSPSERIFEAGIR